MVKFENFNLSLTYALAGGIRETVFENDPNEYLLDHFEINNVFIEKALKPSKYPILLDFIRDKIYSWAEEWGRVYIEEDWEKILTDYEIDFSLQKTQKDLNDDEGDYEDILEEMVMNEVLPKVYLEVFTLLFGDRVFLQKFNLLLSEKIKTLEVSEFPTLLESDGKVKRNLQWNSWVKDAVICRDKNRCASCLIDLSGTIAAGQPYHIDHIIPLKIGGTNDTGNLQLLCDKCNTSKGGNKIITSNKYPVYWEIDKSKL